MQPRKRSASAPPAQESTRSIHKSKCQSVLVWGHTSVLEATRPSGMDTGFQKRLEDAGYPSVAAIFSRDGYIRFLRLDDDLEIEIYGSGVEQHGKNSFRLTASS